ncbi:class I SAM-dependent methyltransferase [Cohnella sp. AR92]|uniref:class I SAM-dependent methyltransferase n=1 Tax=Cohnella sp. AR92 TaxID=648716 RepID=UPI000F8C6AC7|nr:class I SAM-dependent methyltransferase [Cohnella sp. AR92]RUS47051.1 class I SAM-dependent methyltransferase [Cohnella sp. AR92]
MLRRKGAPTEDQDPYVIRLEYPLYPIPRFGWNGPPHTQLSRILKNGMVRFEAYLDQFLKLRPQLARIAQKHSFTEPGKPYWFNRWLPGMDAIALYGFVAVSKPERYYEIGSGMSTSFVRQAILDFNLTTKILSIDPQPRSEIDAICDTVVRLPLEETSLELFDDLEPGDILFVDSSHRSFTNSDVTIAVLEVLPRLKPGVLVHFHDIFLPYDYPPQMSDRYYNEQYLLAAMLLGGGTRYTVEFPCYYLARSGECKAAEGEDVLWQEIGLAPEQVVGGSFWIKVAEDPVK